MNVMPLSMACWIVRTAALPSTVAPNVFPPSPITDTFNPLDPRFRCSTARDLSCVKRPASAGLVLHIAMIALIDRLCFHVLDADELLLECRQIFGHDLPDDIEIDIGIAMNDLIAHVVRTFER